MAAALPFSLAHAEPGNGCVAETVGGGQDTAAVCTYTADGGAQYVLATPNTWSITARRGSRTIVLAARGVLSPPTQGTVDTRAGDRVTVTLGPDCATDGVCGWIGALMVFETE